MLSIQRLGLSHLVARPRPPVGYDHLTLQLNITWAVTWGDQSVNCDVTRRDQSVNYDVTRRDCDLRRSVCELWCYQAWLWLEEISLWTMMLPGVTVTWGDQSVNYDVTRCDQSVNYDVTRRDWCRNCSLIGCDTFHKNMDHHSNKILFNYYSNIIHYSHMWHLPSLAQILFSTPSLWNSFRLCVEFSQKCNCKWCTVRVSGMCCNNNINNNNNNGFV